jgi:uncharacterized protein YkwD
MKKIMRTMMFVVMLITMNSCSAETPGMTKKPVTNENSNTTNYVYNNSELELMQLINKYRVSIGLNALEKANFISNQCEDHNQYMIANNVMNHNGFDSRSQNIRKGLGAKSIAENVAHNYKTSQAALKAWLESPGHKKNIEGNFTHFGIAVSTDASGKKYYTNIFAKI